MKAFMNLILAAAIGFLYAGAGCSGKTIETFLGDDDVPVASTDSEECGPSWKEISGNPLFGGIVSGTDRAYYPSVLKVGSTYHIWYGDGNTTRHGTSAQADFSTMVHPAPEITVSGTPISGLGYTWMYHPHVLYNSAGWDIKGTHYTEVFLLYITPGFNSVRVYVSATGDDWTEIGLCTGVTGAGGYVPQGSNVYALAVLYEGGTDWKAYADNGGGQIQYYTSTNGFDWTGQAADILGTPYQAWEGVHNGIAPFIMKDGSNYLLYYSSGMTRNDSAIGKAVSTDARNFTKDAGNPIFSITDGTAWRNDRTYTPCIIRDGDRWRMYFTGRSTAGVYAIGMARLCGSL